MATYLIKVSLIWLFFLLVYECLYKNSHSFTLNRIYLFVAIAAGIGIPFISWNFPGWPSDISGVGPVHTGIQQLSQLTSPVTRDTGQAGLLIPDVYTFLKWLYLLGVVVVLLLNFREIVLIIRTAVYGEYRILGNHKIFSNERTHAPFSFMGWIFISHPEQYEGEELAYILKHENAHNRQKHWLDIIIIQIIFVLFWFHPLLWRFRHLLKCNHEYEADYVAAQDNIYGYGSFLLQQSLLKNTPVMAHSFHYSPIKKRITMLTQKRKNTRWKYAFIIPALLTCTLLFAKSIPNNQRVRVGDKTSFMGNDFYWGKATIDSVMVLDPVSSESVWVLTKKDPAIEKVNEERVYSSEFINNQPQFRFEQKDFKQYLIEKFRGAIKDVPDSITQIQVNNIVLDNRGKIIYYDILYVNENTTNPSGINNNNPTLDPIWEKIISNSPLWLPAVKEGKAVPSFVMQGGVLDLKSLR